MSKSPLLPIVAPADFSEECSLDFLGIGAQKAGTTWLYEMLDLSNEIGFAERKEMHFWDKAQIRLRSIQRYNQKFRDIPGKIRGDITPAYALLESTVIETIHNFFPNLKFIFLMRNPVTRAWSHARMEAQKQKIGLDNIKWLEEHCLSEASLARGDYHGCLENWYAHFDREKFLLLIYEEIPIRPRELILRSAKHLGVKPSFVEAIDSARLSKPIFASPSVDLPIETRRRLSAHYAPGIERLARFVDIDLHRYWNDEPAASGNINPS